jgi:hypothetical protein
MSVNSKEFRKLRKAVTEALRKGAADESRQRKDNRIQGLLLIESEIFEEISSKDSPFVAQGEIVSSDLQQIAKTITKDLWKLFETVTKAKKFYPGQEADFIDELGPALFFDRGKNLIYYHGNKGSDNFKGLGATASSPLGQVKSALRGRPLTDPTRVFMLPNAFYLEQKARLDEQLDKDFLNSGLADQLNTKQKNKWKENQRLRRPEYKKLRDKFPFNIEGTNLGHVFGGKVTVATGLFANREDVATQDLEQIKLLSAIPSSIQPEIKQVIIDIVAKDANIKYERMVSRNSVFGQISIIAPELARKNKRSGQEATKIFTDRLVPLLKGINLEEIEGSPSFQKLIEDLVIDAFLDKPAKNKRYTTNARIKRGKNKISIPVNTIKGGTVKVTKKSGRTSQEKPTGDSLASLIALINSKLHDKIRQNMGKGNSKQILNYRTGRFAKSVKLDNLIRAREKNAVLANIDYHGFPYSRFADKGDPLWKPGRDIRGIIGRSIRQILQEEKIANLRRVKVTFNNE